MAQLNFVKSILLALIVFTGAPTFAASEFSFRFGGFGSQFGGPVTGEIPAVGNLEFDYGIFMSNKSSLNFRYAFATAVPDVKGEYYFAGVGTRYFFGSKGLPVEGDSAGVTINVSSPWRHFIGWDAGISQMIVKSFGQAVQINSSMFDAGAYVGTVYQFDNRIGAIGLAGMSVGYGFSSVAVLSTNYRMMTGLSYLF